jgi:hypothetical protein
VSCVSARVSAGSPPDVALVAAPAWPASPVRLTCLGMPRQVVPSTRLTGSTGPIGCIGIEQPLKWPSTKGVVMDPVIIVVIVVVVVLIVVALVVLVPRARRQANERRQVQATAHRREAERLAAQAASAQAAAEEREAAARRERAEAELRAGEAQRDAEASLTEAERRRAEAQRLEAKAAKLDPDYTDRGNGTGLRGDESPSSTRGVRPDDHPVGRQDGPDADRGNDNPTPDDGSASPEDPRLADRRDEPGPIR